MWIFNRTEIYKFSEELKYFHIKIFFFFNFKALIAFNIVVGCINASQGDVSCMYIYFDLDFARFGTFKTYQRFLGLNNLIDLSFHERISKKDEKMKWHY